MASAGVVHTSGSISSSGRHKLLSMQELGVDESEAPKLSIPRPRPTFGSCIDIPPFKTWPLLAKTATVAVAVGLAAVALLLSITALTGSGGTKSSGGGQFPSVSVCYSGGKTDYEKALCVHEVVPMGPVGDVGPPLRNEARR